MFSENINKIVVKDLLTQVEIIEIEQNQSRGSMPLVAICDKETNTFFKGYYPLNATIDDDLTVHRVSGVLDILPFVSGG